MNTTLLTTLPISVVLLMMAILCIFIGRVATAALFVTTIAMLWLSGALEMTTSATVAYIASHPITVAGMFAGYILLGTVWARVAFGLELRKIAHSYDKSKVQKGIEDLKNKDFDFSKITQYQQYDRVANADNDAIFAVNRMIEIANTYVGKNLGAAVVHSLIFNNPERVFQLYKWRIIRHTWEYPINIITWLFRDMVVEAARAVTTMLRSIYIKIATKYSAEISADFGSPTKSEDKK